MKVRYFSRSIQLILALIALNIVLSPAVLAKERRVIVGFHKDPGAREEALIEGHRGRFKRKFSRSRAVSADLSDQAIQSLKSNPDVAYVEEDYIVSLVNPVFDGIEYENAWGVARIGSAEVHASGILGKRVKVAVLDTGIDYTHPELSLQYAGGARFIDGDDPANMDPWDDGYNSHGTHVAGVIAAAANGDGVVGVAPDVSLYAVKVLHAMGFGYVSDVIAGIDWAIEQDMDIVNISIGLDQYSQALADACARADEAGVLLVAASGNTGAYGGQVLYPAAYPSVIAVGATTQDDSGYYGSAYGPEIELTAPGAGILSTQVYGGYGKLTGTSQASPHVTGVAALILSAGLDDINGDGFINQQDLRLLLHSTAMDLGASGKDDTYGYGLVNAKAALMGVKNERGQKRRRCEAKGRGRGQANCKGRDYSRSNGQRNRFLAGREDRDDD